MLIEAACTCLTGYKFDEATKTCIKDSSVTPITVTSTFFSKKEQKVTIQFSEKIKIPDFTQLNHTIS